MRDVEVIDAEIANLQEGWRVYHFSKNINSDDLTKKYNEVTAKLNALFEELKEIESKPKRKRNGDKNAR